LQSSYILRVGSSKFDEKLLQRKPVEEEKFSFPSIQCDRTQENVLLSLKLIENKKMCRVSVRRFSVWDFPKVQWQIQKKTEQRTIKEIQFLYDKYLILSREKIMFQLRKTAKILQFRVFKSTSTQNIKLGPKKFKTDEMTDGKRRTARSGLGQKASAAIGL
jgi:hypothetical protein